MVVLCGVYHLVLLITSSIICQEKKVRKLYLALAAAPVPIGILTHYMRPINMAPRLVSRGKQVAILIFCLHERDKNRQRERERESLIMLKLRFLIWIKGYNSCRYACVYSQVSNTQKS